MMGVLHLQAICMALLQHIDLPMILTIKWRSSILSIIAQKHRTLMISMPIG